MQQVEANLTASVLAAAQFRQAKSSATLLCRKVDHLTMMPVAKKNQVTSKAAIGFFLNQLDRTWGLTAYCGWERLLLGRRSLVQVPSALCRQARAGDSHYEEGIMECHFQPDDHHIGPGP